MGDAFVSGLVSEILGRLTSVAINEFGLVWGFNEDVSTLKDYFKQIQAVLQDAEKKRSKEASVELWLKRLRSESLKMENVFDEISAEVMLRKLHKELGKKYSVRAFFSSDHNKLMFRTRIAHKVKAIRKKIADIAAQRYELNLTQPNGIINVDADVGVWGEMPNRETSSLIHKSMIYGRDEEMETVTKKICSKVINNHDVVDDIRVYAIWGMGGLGKTTLAQLVYNHEKVNKYFEIKCWMYVSEKFKVKELIKGVIESIGDAKDIPSQLDALQVRLQKVLQGKRFLIVLDDVWIEDEEKSEWDKLSNALSCGAEGSFVLVTTRNKTTSKMMAKVPEFQHELGFLSKEDSWLLFEKLAFAEGRSGGDKTELDPIGKEIVKKCKGLPLAVKTLGGLMWSKSSTSDWEHVMRSNIWELQDNNILPALKLSYDNLLPHIKRCFAYCCLFPKGYEMENDLLILLWMANGFIPPRGEASSYVLGEEIYNCLVWRSFFQVVDGKYKMHDLMHDLAQYVMRDDCLVIEPDKNPITPEDVLHLSSSSSSDSIFSNIDLKRFKSLRSIFILKEFDHEGSIRRIFELVYLRVICLFEIKSFPESICKLKYLKYLNLSYSKIKVLTKSIIYLQNLQVLILEWCTYLCKLPEGLRYMRNLQHLNIKGCTSLEYWPVGILKGVNDFRFTYFPVGKKKGAKIGELGDVINFVESELEIRGLENVEGGLREAKNVNLKSKTNLLVLRLYWGYDYFENAESKRIALNEEALEGLEPNPSLEELEIKKCTGKNISPSWIVNLNNLVKIKFVLCSKCENIPPLGKLPSLKSISFHTMDFLKCFHDEDYNTSKSGDYKFPVLQVLIINDCRNLVSLPSYFPELNRLLIYDCESLIYLPDEIQSFKDLNELEIIGCENLSRRYNKEMGGVDWPKISHVPSITIGHYSWYN